MSKKPRVSAIQLSQSYGARDCPVWRQQFFDLFPLVAEDLAAGFVSVARIEGNAAGNRWLRAIAESLKAGPWNVTHDDEALVDYAKAQALAIERATARAYTNDKFRVYVFRPVDRLLVWPVASRAEAYRFMARASAVEERGGMWTAIQVGELCCRAHEIDPPAESFFSLKGRVLRMSSAKWWRRKLRVLSARRLEQFMREVGRVHKRAGIYCSDLNVKRRSKQHRRNRDMLMSQEAVNQHDQCMTLAELSDRSVANPDIRRAELMLRIRDTEKEALRAGDVGIFYTITCPSKFHPVHSGTCKRNPKYNGATPRDAQDYLTQLWARIRARFKAKKIQVYGVRVAEPHHDGTPHWHLLLWMKPEEREQVTSIMRRYALAEDGDEHGAQRYRFDHEVMNPHKGGAISYIAKYISKNINGQQFAEFDQYGKPLESSAPRIEAWAGVWGIRQFQFVGLPSVTVWREMRRITSDKQTLLREWEETFGYANSVIELMAAMRDACDNSEWDRYISLMGGPCTPLKDQPVRPWVEVRLDERSPDYIAHNGYGETCEVRYGVLVKGSQYMTRFYKWTVRPASKRRGFEDSDATASPWTRVNNCTPTGKGEYVGPPAVDEFLSTHARLLETDHTFPSLPPDKQISTVTDYLNRKIRMNTILAPQPKPEPERVATEKRYRRWAASAEMQAEAEDEQEMIRLIRIMACRRNDPMPDPANGAWMPRHPMTHEPVFYTANPKNLLKKTWKPALPH